MAIIPIAQHPANLDPSATLVSGSRERFSIFRVRDGYVPCIDGRTYSRTFATEAAARDALVGLSGLK